MIENGELSLGVPCAPFQITSFTVAEGQVQKKHTVVTGRKFPLKEIRKKTLAQQEKFMRLYTDEEINTMADKELALILTQMNVKTDDDSDKREALRHSQRRRGIDIWHDHGTVLGLGVVMITAHILYDPAVFYTQAEIDAKQGLPAHTNIQATVENPIIHILAACSSSVDDQAAIVQDRVDCLPELADPLKTSGGITITDELLFFVGHHPAKQFERGTQAGGTYKCGGCGVKDIMMDHLAHTLQLPRRSLYDLQHLATSGK